MKKRELSVDNFAGGGGASCGFELALGIPVDIAINHDPDAIAMHRVNHPKTLHYCESVFDVDPVTAVAGHPVAAAWFSPDCKHFSKAKGGRPVDKKIRGLAWVKLRWALLVRPRVIYLENVEEFQTWGPLGEDNQPIKSRKGEYFSAFVKMLGASLSIEEQHQYAAPIAEVKDVLSLDDISLQKLINGLGYNVEYRELLASDYGVPQKRNRFFMISRCDGQPIVWPEPTHYDPSNPKKSDISKGLKPWRTAAEIIDWSIPCPSIFERSKPLAENTLKRIAKGFVRYVINNPKPFIVKCNHTSTRTIYDAFRGQSIMEPLQTITQSPGFALINPVVTPFITEHANASQQRNMPINEPLRTICAQVKGGHFAVVTPTLVPESPEEVDTSSFICRQFGQSVGHGMDSPLGTVTAGGGGKSSLISAFLVKHYSGVVGAELTTPLPTVTTVDHNSVVDAKMVQLNSDAEQYPHQHQVYAFLVKYYGADIGQDLNDPLHTVTTRDRFGLVTIDIDGITYKVVDIGMRMLKPRELFDASSFPQNYVIDTDHNGKAISQKVQVARCGNAVPPELAAALIRANNPELMHPDLKQDIEAA